MCRLLLSIFASFLISSCGNKKVSSTASKELISSFSGTFSNVEQAKSDSTFQAITHINERFWEEDVHTIWFYTERYTDRSPEQANFQRIIAFEPIDEGGFNTRFYFIDGFHLYASQSKFRKDLNAIKKDQLIPQKGCSFITFKEGLEWTLQSEHKDCISSLNKAIYTDVFYSWDGKQLLDGCKGIDIDGNRVWGSPTPYILKKKAAQ
jgi:hypothetical protein